MKSLKITNQATSFLESLDAKQFRQVLKKILSLMQDSMPQDSAGLGGAKNGERRVDSGEYRIIYKTSETEIDVQVIGKRNDDEVYRIWKRML
jgi:mRNA interferase RelE/StbE